MTVPAGHAGAQFQLGITYGSGLGVREDAALSIAWYRRAAEPGLPEAQTALGDLDAKGIGVAADLEAARDWYEKAAAQDHAPVQAKLATLQGPRITATVQPLQMRRSADPPQHRPASLVNV
jgi:uncharacterized protein